MTRQLILLTTSVLALVGYLLLLLTSHDIDHLIERKFPASASRDIHVQIYLELISIDTARNAMQVYVSIEPNPLSVDAKSIPTNRDLILVIAHDKQVNRIKVYAHQPIPTIPIEIDLYDRDITHYPLDAYKASLSIQCFDLPALSDAQPNQLPMDVTVWERVLGFSFQTAEEPSGVSGQGRLTFQIKRSLAVTFFALASYGVMGVLACVAMTIGTLTFLGIRRPEATLMGALGAIVFALPALRSALPGGAPLGVLADVFVFLWAELVVVVALVLVATTWARSGPSP